jgi:ascorbate-specific PTS system EIIC-type component UlaA
MEAREMPNTAGDSRDRKRDEHFQNYSDYSRSLRTWLVAYGVGGPVLFVTNETLAARIAESGYAGQIGSAFLLGVALQIILSLINKWGAWHMYAGTGDDEYQATRRYRFWAFVNQQSWLDLVLDVVSFGAFIFATWRVMGVFLD